MIRYFKNYVIIAFLTIISMSILKSETIDSAYVYNNYSQIAEKIINKVMQDSSAWERLAYMCDMFGSRLSGSEGLTNAIMWGKREMEQENYSKVWLEEVLVPNWKRGTSEMYMTSPRMQKINVEALGGSISTNGIIEAPVLVVSSFDELDSLKDKVKGKIVLYNYPYKGYGNGVQFRFWGAVRAAKYGAVASIIKSISPIGFGKIHTGMMRYVDSVPQIPHASISLEDALFLERMQKRGITPTLKLKLTCQTLPDTISYNLMAEIKGTEFSEEVVAMGGHSDSWDLSTSAHDDASGIIAPWQALKIINELGLKPRRTLRTVWWVNEENGVRGGNNYAEVHKNEKHKIVFEFDSGVFEPVSVGISGDDHLVQVMKGIEPIIKKIVPDFAVKVGGGGVDIGPMMKLGVVGSSLNPKGGDQYFWYHHSNSDTPDKIDPIIFNKCVTVIAIANYIYADLPNFVSSN